MKRKIIQLAPVMSVSFFNQSFVLYVLCDDGSVWAKQPWIKGDKFDRVDMSEVENHD